MPEIDGHLVAFQDTILAWRPNTKVGHPTSNDRHEAGANSIIQSSTASRPNSAPRRRRQIDISSFNSLLHQISDDSSSPNEPAQRNNPHTVPTPVDVASLFRLVQDQFRTLARDAPETANRDFLISLIDALNSDIFNPVTDKQRRSGAWSGVGFETFIPPRDKYALLHNSGYQQCRLMQSSGLPQ